MSKKGFIRVVAPGIQVWRCTEAIDPRVGFTFRTIGNEDGRCIEIITSQNQMLFDRRMARKLAESILAICGPAGELETDIAEADIVEVVYKDATSTKIKGFKPYVPRTRDAVSDAAAFVRKVRADAGLSPSRLFEQELPEEHNFHG